MEMSVIFDNLLEPLKRLERLVHRYNYDVPIAPFWKIYEKDTELLDFQQKLNDGSVFPFAV